MSDDLSFYQYYINVYDYGWISTGWGLVHTREVTANNVTDLNTVQTTVNFWYTKSLKRSDNISGLAFRRSYLKQNALFSMQGEFLNFRPVTYCGQNNVQTVRRGMKHCTSRFKSMRCYSSATCLFVIILDKKWLLKIERFCWWTGSLQWIFFLHFNVSYHMVSYIPYLYKVIQEVLLCIDKW